MSNSSEFGFVRRTEKKFPFIISFSVVAKDEVEYFLPFFSWKFCQRKKEGKNVKLNYDLISWSSFFCLKHEFEVF
jgi:hypothetical protein